MAVTSFYMDFNMHGNSIKNVCVHPVASLPSDATDGTVVVLLSDSGSNAAGFYCYYSSTWHRLSQDVSSKFSALESRLAEDEQDIATLQGYFTDGAINETLKLKNPVNIIIGKQTNPFDGSRAITFNAASMGVATQESVVKALNDAAIARATVGTVPTGYDTVGEWITYLNNMTGTAYRYKGSVTYANLPSSDNVIGDVYNVTDEHDGVAAGTNYAWNGTEWDALAGIVDLSPYLKISDAASTYAAKSDLAGKAEDADVVHLAGTETITGEKVFTANAANYNKSESNAAVKTPRLSITGATEASDSSKVHSMLDFLAGSTKKGYLCYDSTYADGTGGIALSGRSDSEILAVGQNVSNPSATAIRFDANGVWKGGTKDTFSDELLMLTKGDLSTSLKTINGESLSGSGDITIPTVLYATVTYDSDASELVIDMSNPSATAIVFDSASTNLDFTV